MTMRVAERSLRTLQTEVRFELQRIGAELAQMAALIHETRKQVAAVSQRCESSADAMREVASKPLIDLPLLGAVRRLYRAELRVLLAARGRLVAAEKREQQVRDVLTELR